MIKDGFYHQKKVLILILKKYKIDIIYYIKNLLLSYINEYIKKKIIKKK